MSIINEGRVSQMSAQGERALARCVSGFCICVDSSQGLGIFRTREDDANLNSNAQRRARTHTCVKYEDLIEI